MSKDTEQSKEIQEVAFGRTFCLLLDALEAEHRRRLEEAVLAAMCEQGYEAGRVTADLSRRVWLVPDKGGADQGE